MADPTLDVTALDHLYITVADLRRSEAFYDPVMRLLGFRKGTTPIGGDPHVHYFNRVTQYSLRPARVPSAYDPYRPGLHHVCFRVATPADVDAAAHGLATLGVATTPPKVYPEYAADYYAIFFTDPDGIGLELVAHRRVRTLIVEHWDELKDFEDPLRKAGLI